MQVELSAEERLIPLTAFSKNIASDWLVAYIVVDKLVFFKDRVVQDKF